MTHWARKSDFFDNLANDLSEAVAIRVRYETPDHTGETRRERNTRFEQPSPDWQVPDGGQYLWDWFEEISSGITRVNNGSVRRLEWSDLIAWREISGNIVRPEEWAILRAMDESCCAALATEISDAHVRARAEAEANQ